MIKIQMTYDKVTPESAEHGDFSDQGFAKPGGWEFSTSNEAFWKREKEIGHQKALMEQVPDPEEFESLEDVIEFLESYYCFNPSSSFFHKGIWYTEGDPTIDHATCEETRLSFHIIASEETEKMVYDALKEKNLLL
jgi:hypothetical protein